MNKQVKTENKLESSIKVEILQLNNIKIKDPILLNDFIETEVKRIKIDFLEQLPQGYTDSRKLYRSVKIDPTKYRPSSESLWRRIKKGLPFPKVNSFVDMINYLSLKHQTSYGLYDLDKIDGNISVELGTEADSYEGIRKDRVNLKGKITLKDKIGSFGNPSSDSLRTSTNEKTKNLLVVIFFYKESNQIKYIKEDSYNNFSNHFDFFSNLS